MHSVAVRSNANNFNRPIDVNDAAEGPDQLGREAPFHARGCSPDPWQHGALPGDIHYTLRHIPNHYGALEAMARYQLQHPGESKRYLTVDCYFERAFAFRPKDARLYLLYGTYLHRAGRWDKAGAAVCARRGAGPRLRPSSTTTAACWNFERNNYEAAATYAAKAYAGGYPLPALRNKLGRPESASRAN